MHKLQCSLLEEQHRPFLSLKGCGCLKRAGRTRSVSSDSGTWFSESFNRNGPSSNHFLEVFQSKFIMLVFFP